MEITYDSIKPLIFAEETDGPMIKLKFKAKNQDTPLETMAYVAIDQAELMANVTKQMGKSMATGMAIQTASGLLGKALGGAGAVVSSDVGSAVARQAASKAFDAEALVSTDVTDEKKQAAIVQAFSYLATFYKHNGTQWEYVQPTAPSAPES